MSIYYSSRQEEIKEERRNNVGLNLVGLQTDIIRLLKKFGKSTEDGWYLSSTDPSGGIEFQVLTNKIQIQFQIRPYTAGGDIDYKYNGLVNDMDEFDTIQLLHEIITTIL